MAEAEFASPSGIEWNGHVGKVNYGTGDRSMMVMFYHKPEHDPVKSAESGRPQFVDKVYVRIQAPGERLTVIDREAKREDTQRFAQQWAMFQQQKAQVPEGTPIDLFYPEQPSVAALMRANGVQTIEQLAELSANAIENIGMGAQRYVNDAQTYLRQAEKGIKATQHRKDLEERDREIKMLKQQVADLRSQIDTIIASNIARGEQQFQVGAAQQMGRPLNLPGTNFDPQQAQLNAMHPAAGHRAAPASKPKRQRARLTG